MGSKGSNTSTTNTTSGPPAYIQAAYQQLLGNAQNTANTPFTPYQGQMVAGFSPDQINAFGLVNQAQGSAMPYINQAAQYASQGAGPVGALTTSDINAYYNPYQQQVVNATLANINETNAQQQQQVKGNAALQGALGGDRSKVAQAELARQQNLAGNQTLANLQSQGFTTALGAAQNQQDNAQKNAARAGQAAYTYGSLGQEALGTTLTGANAQLQTGGQQQQLAQANLNWPYQQWMMERAYPFQTQQWLAGIASGLGSTAGGTSQAVSTKPEPNPYAQVAGLGLTAAGMFAHGGGRVPGFDDGGGVGGGIGGVPYMGASGYVPGMPNLGHGSSIPKPLEPKFDTANPNTKDMMKGAVTLGRGLKDFINEPAAPTPLAAPGMADQYGTGKVGDIMPSYGPTGGLYAGGGMVPGFAGGGTPGFSPIDFEDRWAPMTAATESGEIVPIGGSTGARPAQPLREMPRSVPPAEIDDPDSSYNRDLHDDAMGGKPLGFAPEDDPPRPPAPIPGDGSGVDHEPSALNPAGGVSDVGAGAVSPESAPAPKPSERGLVPDKYRGAMIATGLGMLASKSKNFGNALGEGGLMGVAQYGAEQKEGRENRKEVSDSEYKRAHAQYLRDTAIKAQKQLNISQQNADSQEAYRKDAVAERVRAAKERETENARSHKEREEQRKIEADQRDRQALEREGERAARLAEQERANREREEGRRDEAARRRDEGFRHGYTGDGVDPATGKTVPGLYQFNPDTRQYDFQPGKAKTALPKGPTASETRALEGAKSSVALIDESIGMLDRSIAGESGPVSGLAGAANRLWQFGKGVLDLEHDTTPSDFQQNIQLLQARLPRLLAGTSRINAADRGEFDSIVAGLSKLKTPEEVRSNLLRLKEILSRENKIDSVAPMTRGDGPPPKPAGAPPDARLGTDDAGRPAWFAPDPARPGKFLKLGAP